ncbi:MAG: hypothetical protein ACOC8B_08000 [Gemmatimonadota bacterium]
MPTPSLDARALVPILTLALAIPACGDATGPRGAVIVHVAHAAPGAGPFRLAMNGEVVADGLGTGDALVRTLSGGPYTVSLEGADGEFAVRGRWNAETDRRLGLVAMNGADPQLASFDAANAVAASQVSFRVINAVPADEPLTISVRSADSGGGISATLGFGTTGGSFGLDAGTYRVSAYADDPDAAVDLGEVTLGGDVHFIVVGPDESGTRPGLALAF